MSSRADDAIVIVGVGAVCPVGNGIRQVDASVRAGLGAQAQSALMNQWFEPMTLALFPEESLEALQPKLESMPWPAAQLRQLRLAAPALREAVLPLPEGACPALFMALPEPHVGAAPLEAADLVSALLAQAKVSFSTATARLFPTGRAAGLVALEAAVAALEQGRAEWSIVGGADSYLDLLRLGQLDAEQRLLGPRVMDGFVPGEGAAFALLTTRRVARRYQLDATIGVSGVAVATDPGHRYGTEPARGEGLSDALESLTRRAPPPIRRVYAGLNGESFGAKEWGVARIRHAVHFAQDAAIEHPADCYGDLGAATGPVLLALAEKALRRGNAGPVLVWASSDREERACALLHTVT